jgi:hypothetical protein
MIISVEEGKIQEVAVPNTRLYKPGIWVKDCGKPCESSVRIVGALGKI